jgi:hypothetical protein
VGKERGRKEERAKRTRFSVAEKKKEMKAKSELLLSRR